MTRRYHYYPSKIEPISQDAERTQIDKWNMDRPDPVRRSRFVTAVFAVSLFFINIEPITAEVVTVDKWFVQVSEPQRDKRPIDLSSMAEPPSRTAIENETSKLEWRPNFYENPVLPKDYRWTYPYFFPDTLLHIIPGITLDRWYRPIVQPIFKKPEIVRQEFTEPPDRVVLEAEVSVFQWRPNFYDNPVLREDFRWTYPNFFPDAQLHEVPAITVVDAETFEIDLYIDQARAITANITQARARDLYIEQARSIDLER